MREVVLLLLIAQSVFGYYEYYKQPDTFCEHPDEFMLFGQSLFKEEQITRLCNTTTPDTYDKMFEMYMSNVFAYLFLYSVVFILNFEIAIFLNLPIFCFYHPIIVLFVAVNMAINTVLFAAADFFIINIVTFCQYKAFFRMKWAWEDVSALVWESTLVVIIGMFMWTSFRFACVFLEIE